MNRSTAREIAVHFAFELAFSDEKAGQLLDREPYPDRENLRRLARRGTYHGR